MFPRFSGLQAVLQENEGILSKLHDRVKQEGGDVSCFFSQQANTCSKLRIKKDELAEFFQRVDRCAECDY